MNNSDLESGTVICNFGGGSLVENSTNVLLPCKVRKTLLRPVAGDEVQFCRTGVGEGVIEIINPRRTELARPDKYGRVKTLAANVTQLVVVAAVRPEVNVDLLDHYLVAAEALGAEPLLVLNKVDMQDDAALAAARVCMAECAEIGYRVAEVSTVGEPGIAALSACLAGHASVFVGQSGVGKSSLIRAILGDRDDIRVGALALSGEGGTHTTSETTLYRIADGAVLDSPGVREFRLWNIDPAGILRGFREFRPYLGNCRFNDCKHISEPGCAIIGAVNAGAIKKRRWESYHRVLASLPNKPAWQR